MVNILSFLFCSLLLVCVCLDDEQKKDIILFTENFQTPVNVIKSHHKCFLYNIFWFWVSFGALLISTINNETPFLVFIAIMYNFKMTYRIQATWKHVYPWILGNLQTNTKHEKELFNLFKKNEHNTKTHGKCENFKRVN